MVGFKAKVLFILIKIVYQSDIAKSDNEDVCSSAILDCTENQETVDITIRVNKIPHFTGVPRGSEEDVLTLRDCADVYNSGEKRDGIYTIRPTQLTQPVQVYCDMTEDGGGWTKLMRRQDGSVNFARRWEIYKNGFGELSGEHWLGNDKIAALTRQRLYMLRIRLLNFQNETRYADYSSIEVAPEWDKYCLHIGKYSGDAGDSFSFHNNQKFTTLDDDNDMHSTNCGQDFSAGNWFKNCFRAGLTNFYSHVPNLEKTWGGIVWNAWEGANIALQRVEMKIRPVDFI